MTGLSFDSRYGEYYVNGYTHGHVKHGAKEWSYYDYRHDATHPKGVNLCWRYLP